MSFVQRKKEPQPKPDEAKFVQNLEIEILQQITKALKGHRSLEAYMLAWTSVEQFMLPRLMQFVAHTLKIDLPKNIAEIPFSQTTRLYYHMSHDKELFLSLEKSRKNRNKLVHRMYQAKTWSQIKKDYRDCLKKDFSNLFTLFQDRFNGKTKIPSLTLYVKGWNDGLDAAIKVIKTS